MCYIFNLNDNRDPDFISKIEGMFRLLDIVSETGSGGLGAFSFILQDYSVKLTYIVKITKIIFFHH